MRFTWSHITAINILRVVFIAVLNTSSVDRASDLQSAVKQQTHIELEEGAACAAAQGTTAEILMGYVEQHQGGGQHGIVRLI